MHTHHKAGLFTKGLFVIRELGPIGCTDLSERRPGLNEHIGDPKISTDLDQFPARDDDLAAICKYLEHEKRGRSAVVYNKGRFRPRQLHQKALDVRTALSAATGRQVIFERAVTRRILNRFYRFGRERCAAQVGVYDDAGGVYDLARTGLPSF